MTQSDALNWINGGWSQSPYAQQRSYGLGIDQDGFYGFQCKDFVNAYAIWLGHPFTAGNARTLWEQPQDPWWIKTSDPHPGDVAVFKPNAGNGQAGHTSLVKSVGNGVFTSEDQNWINSNPDHGSPPSEVQHNLSGIYGFLRPQLGDEMKLTPAEVNQLAMIAWNRPATDTEKSVYPTLDAQETLQRVLTSDLNIKIRTLAQQQIDAGK